MINISELITDPDFCQPNGIKITRFTTKVVNHVPVETEDSMLDQADLNKERIHVFTHQRLKCTGRDKLDGKDYSSDVVHFNGNDYIVRYCLDDAQYGFCRSTAIKMDPERM